MSRDRLLLNVLSELETLPEYDDHGRLRPLPSVSIRAKLIVLRLPAELATLVGEDYVAPDYDGSIRISWYRARELIRLIVHADESGQYTVYHERSDSAHVVEFRSINECADYLSAYVRKLNA